MMRAVSELTRPYAVPTTVSLNAIMVDGTGMCGGCRVTIGGKTKYACVDGPEFDGHQVDFKMLSDRLVTYRAFEQQALERREACKIGLRKPTAGEAATATPGETATAVAEGTVR
jgi:ferredoxin--NADP+ reductase